LQKPLTRATQRDPQKIAAWGAGLSVDRGAGKARKGGDLLERRDGYLQPGSDRQRLPAKRTGAYPDANRTEVLNEHDRRREQSRPHQA
jgi:hypothetical protein